MTISARDPAYYAVHVPGGSATEFITHLIDDKATFSLSSHLHTQHPRGYFYSASAHQALRLISVVTERVCCDS